MTIENAVRAAQQYGDTVLSDTNIHIYGAAANAEKMAKLLGKVNGDTNGLVTSQIERYDPVAHLVGFNQTTWGPVKKSLIGKLKEAGSTFTSEYSPHGCYGLAPQQCQKKYGSPQSTPFWTNDYK